MLEQRERLLDRVGDVDVDAGSRLGTAEIEEPVNDALAAVHLVIDDATVLPERVSKRGVEFTVGQLEADALGAGGDGGERVVDLMHDAGRELSQGGELLC